MYVRNTYVQKAKMSETSFWNLFFENFALASLGV
jgi:hypothetical protein